MTARRPATTDPTVVAHVLEHVAALVRREARVYDGRHWDFYRQALAVEFQPTLFPAVAPATSRAPATDPCGSLTSPEKGAITGLGNLAFQRLTGGTTTVEGAYVNTTGDVGGSVPAQLSLSLGSPATFGPFTAGVARDYDASMTANVISTAGDATLSHRRPEPERHRAPRQRRVRAAVGGPGQRLQPERHGQRADARRRRARTRPPC